MADETAPAGHSGRPDEPPSDRSLLRRFRAGQPDAATLLFLRYAERLQGLARARFASDLKPRVDPDDLVQSVFRTFFRRARLTHYDVPEGGDLWKLFLVIALNKIRNTATFHRAGKRDSRLTGSVDRSAEIGTGGGEQLAILRLVIDEQLERLDPSQRAIVEQRIEGYEVAEIAARTERSKRSVERVLQAFRHDLERVLHEDLGDDDDA